MKSNPKPRVLIKLMSPRFIVISKPRFQHLPVVLVTSLDTVEDRERGITAGADAYIVKRQFEQQILLDTIARLI